MKNSTTNNDLGISEKVLTFIMGAQKRTTREIGAHFDLTLSAATLILNALAKKELISKNVIKTHTEFNTRASVEWVVSPLAFEYIDDSNNPRFMFSTTNTSLLAAAARGEINLLYFAKKELANRGLDANGVWVGFGAAKEIHFGK